MDAQARLTVRSLILLFLVAGAGFMLWLLYTTDYSLSEAELPVRSEPLRFRVPLSEIQSVTPSRDRRSSPAGSLDRLLIRWSVADEQLLVSPEPRHEFLQELSRRCPHLSLNGDQLTREGAA